MAKIKSEPQDIGQVLRSLGPKPRRPRAVREHRVGGLRGIRPVRILKTSRIVQSVKREGRLVPNPIRSRVRVDNVILQPTADRAFHGELDEYEDLETGHRSLQYDPQSLILEFDGACRGHGTFDAQASYGVFVSYHRPSLNFSGLLPIECKQTSQFAALYAALQAIDKVHLRIINGFTPSHLVLVTNSAYLVNGMSVFIWKWLGNGFVNCAGQPVENGPMFNYLHEKLDLLERQYGFKVSFCRISREDNGGASWFARLALGESSDYGSF